MDVSLPITAGALSQQLNAILLGNAEEEIQMLAPLSDLGPHKLSFYSDSKYQSQLEKKSGGVLLANSSTLKDKISSTLIIVKDPRSVFNQISAQFKVLPNAEGISKFAHIHSGAKIASGVGIGPFATVEEGVTIEEGSRIGAYAYVGKGVYIGKDCQIFPRVTLLDRVSVGDRVQIFPGAVIGGDGFGFLGSDSQREAVPQVGTVKIESDVRIGSLVSIDRATLGETLIGAGTKIDDHVHVGHNCQIGRNVILCGMVGLSGSVVLEDGVVLGGKVGVADHGRIGKGARVGALSGVNNFLEGGKDYFGIPALPIKEWISCFKSFRKIPEILKRLKALEQKNL